MHTTAQRHPRSPATYMRRVGATMVVTAVAFVLQTCGREPTGPSVGGRFSGPVALMLGFPASGGATHAAAVAFDRVRVTFVRADGATALDQMISFPAFADSVVLSFAVPLSPTASVTGDPMDLLVRCIATSGDTVYSGVPTHLLLRPGAAATPVPVVLRYTGPAAKPRVVRLALNTFAASAVAGSLLGGAGGVTATALDSLGRIVTSFVQPVTIALGAARPGSALHGTTTVSAVGGVATFRDLWVGTAAPGYTLTASTAGVPAGTSMTFAIVAASAHAIALLGGNAQSALVGALLPVPLQVAITDAYGNSVNGATVTWQALTGAGALHDASSSTDTAGRAATTWTLGTLLGSQTASATVPGLVGSPVTFAATALAIVGNATHIAFTLAGPIGTTAAGSVLGAAAGGVTVTVLDAAGAVVSSFNGPVTMAIGTNPTGATLGGTTTTNAVNGVATFTDLAITKAGAGYTLVATAAGLPSITSNQFAIVAAAAKALSLVSGNNQSGLISAILPSPLRVLVADTYGNPVSGTNVAWSVVSGGGLLQNPTSTTDATGVASNVWTLGALLGAQAVNAAVAGLTGSPVSFTGSGLPLQQVATQLSMSAIPITAIAGSLLTGTAAVSLRSAPPPR